MANGTTPPGKTNAHADSGVEPGTLAVRYLAITKPLALDDGAVEAIRVY